MGGTKVVRNAAKESKHLLDVISETKSAAIALAEFKSKRASTLTKGDVKELVVPIPSWFERTSCSTLAATRPT